MRRECPILSQAAIAFCGGLSVAQMCFISSDYKPELTRLAEERKVKAEADKNSQLDRLMRDMDVSDAGPSRRGGNPFGPHPRNEREDM